MSTRPNALLRQQVSRWWAVVAVVAISSLVAAVLWWQPGGTTQDDPLAVPDGIRHPSLAAAFYPQEAGPLVESVDFCLATAKPIALPNVRALIVPHGAFPFSGPTAGWGYRQLIGRSYSTVIILAPAHTVVLKNPTVAIDNGFATPLGVVPVSPKAASLARISPFVCDAPCNVALPNWIDANASWTPPADRRTAYTFEHSIEVQLPFLQRVLKDFSIIPVLLPEDLSDAAAPLLGLLDDQTLIIVSTDLSHYYEATVASELDKGFAESVENLDLEALKRQEACGMSAVRTLVQIARRKGWHAKLLNASNSGGGAAAPTKQGVVGYAAMAFWEDPATKPIPVDSLPKTRPQEACSSETKTFLLGLARSSLRKAATTGKVEPLVATSMPAEVLRPGGCYVTLTVNDQLRGRHGSVAPLAPLWQCVRDCTYASATQYEGLRPVEANELDEIQIEIGVVTNLRRLTSTSSVELLSQLQPNIDGILLQSGQSEAAFPPDMWSTCSNKMTLLEALSTQAGLPSKSWASQDTALFTYQVERFSESPPGGAADTPKLSR